MMFNWLNLGLNSTCNKSCSFCGRAEARKNGTLELGEMPLELVNDILTQYDGEIVQINKDGEPLLYNNIWAVGQMCRPFVSNIVTNGILLWEKKDAIIENFTSVTVSVIEDDEAQFEIVKKFIEHKGNRNPMVYIKFLGDYENHEYEMLGLRTMRRSIHNKMGDTDYIQSPPPIPEIGVCLDFLNKPSIDWQGDFHICNRYDPNNEGVIGNCNESGVRKIWESTDRETMKYYHTHGMRENIPLCRGCQYWGLPANG